MLKLSHAGCLDNLMSYWRQISDNNGGVTRETIQLLSLTTGADTPLLNPVMGRGLDLQAQELLDKQHSYWHDSVSNASETLAELINVFPNCMAPVPIMGQMLAAEKIAINLPDGYELKQWHTACDLAGWIDVFQQCYATSDNDTQRYCELLEASQQGLTHFAVYDKVKPVGIATVFTEHQYAGMYNLAVLPEHRRQGLGAALHAARLNFAIEAGFKCATLQAVPMAIGLARNMGFEALSVLTIFNV